MITFGKYLKMKPKKFDADSISNFEELINANNVILLPITHSFYKKATGSSPKHYKRFFHVTDINRVKDLEALEGSRNAISASTLVNEEFTEGIETDGEVIIEVEGDLLYCERTDMYSTPDKNGRRWITLDPFFQNDCKSLIKNIQKIREKYSEDPDGEYIPFNKMTVYIDELVSLSSYKEFLLRHSKYIQPRVSQVFYNECIIDNIKIKRIFLMNCNPLTAKKRLSKYDLIQGDWKQFIRGNI